MIPSACASCHKDVHEPSLGKDCQRCHDDRKFRPAPRFDHAKARYKLEGKHAEAPCASCHPGQGAAQKWKGLAFAKCEDCHADPHKGRNKPTLCATCHTVRGWNLLSDSVRENHAPGVFPLRGKHAAVKCASCHKAGEPHKAAPTRCDGCHQSPHQHDLGAKCATCHVDRGWAVLASARFPHERAGYPLLGKHAQTACGKCHPARGAFAARFLSQKADRCVRCHADPHRTTYKTVADASRCEACHAERGFVPATFGVARHTRPTWPLDGAHLAVACAGCHRRETLPRETRAAFAMHPAAGDCGSCHGNPHGERFARELAQHGCRGCHGTSDWKQARIDHDRTGFALRGRHSQIACAACHTRPASTPAAERYKGAPRACAACHGDPHLGQFAATEPKKSCETCHAASAWKALTFDHGRDARLALDCEKCHERRQTPAGVVVAYRNGRLTCQACHDNHHERRDWRATGAAR
jgi:hypothetical protein